jgi:hypothetical protein
MENGKEEKRMYTPKSGQIKEFVVRVKDCQSPDRKIHNTLSLSRRR